MKFKVGDKVKIQKSPYKAWKKGTECKIHSIVNKHVIYLKTKQKNRTSPPFFKEELELVLTEYKIYKKPEK